MIKIGRLYREKIVELLKEEAKNTEAILFINFKGSNANQLNILRSALKKNQARLLVAKNRLIKRAFESFGESSENFLDEETGVVYSFADVVEVTKTLFDFKKESEKLEIKGGFIEKKVLDTKELEDISKLPSKNILLGMTVNCLASPLTGFLNCLNQVILKFIWTIDQIKKKKEEK